MHYYLAACAYTLLESIGEASVCVHQILPYDFIMCKMYCGKNDVQSRRLC